MEAEERDEEALAAHRAEAEANAAAQEEEPEPEPHPDLKYEIEIKGLDAAGAIPDVRQIEKWIDIGLSRHGNSGVVSAKEV